MAQHRLNCLPFGLRYLCCLEGTRATDTRPQPCLCMKKTEAQIGTFHSVLFFKPSPGLSLLHCDTHGAALDYAACRFLQPARVHSCKIVSVRTSKCRTVPLAQRIPYKWAAESVTGQTISLLCTTNIIKLQTSCMSQHSGQAQMLRLQLVRLPASLWRGWPQIPELSSLSMEV